MDSKCTFGGLVEKKISKKKFLYRYQLGLIFKPLFESFNSTVSVASMEELSRTADLWVDQHCSLIEMRPGKLFDVKQQKEKKIKNFLFVTSCIKSIEILIDDN